MSVLTLTATATFRELVAIGDWSLICATCHYDGSHAGALSAKELQLVRQEADGFGDVRALRRSEPHGEDLWEQVIVEGDWSHFRDSSQEGQERAARAIRTILLSKI